MVSRLLSEEKDMPERSIFFNYFKSLSHNEQPEPAGGQHLFQQVLQTVESLIVVLDTDGRIVAFNGACERLTGFSQDDVLGQTLSEALVPAAEMDGVTKVIQDILTDRLPSYHENHWCTKDGGKRLIFWTNTNVKDESGQVRYLICTGTDITENRKRDIRRQLLMAILETIAVFDDENTALGRILELLKEFTGSDAAGIRLQKGNDFPYAKTLGFSDDFIRKESQLCTCEGSRDASALECLCGQLLSGSETDWLPLTSRGAICAGNINELAGKLGKQNLPFTVRNQCGAVGFKSIALIPLRFRNQPIGLIQLNDRTPDKFHKDDIDFLVFAGQSIGAALSRFLEEQARRRSELILNTIVQKAHDGFSLGKPDGTIVLYNEAMERISGYSKEEVNRHGWFYLAYPNEEERRQAIHKMRLAMAGKLSLVETTITCKDGSQKPVAITVTPLQIEGQTYNFSTMIDVSPKRT